MVLNTGSFLFTSRKLTMEAWTPVAAPERNRFGPTSSFIGLGASNYSKQEMFQLHALKLPFISGLLRWLVRCQSGWRCFWRKTLPNTCPLDFMNISWPWRWFCDEGKHAGWWVPFKMHNDIFFAHAILQGPHLIPRSTSTSVLMTPRSEQTVRCEQSLVSTAGLKQAFSRFPNQTWNSHSALHGVLRKDRRFEVVAPTLQPRFTGPWSNLGTKLHWFWQKTGRVLGFGVTGWDRTDFLGLSTRTDAKFRRQQVLFATCAKFPGSTPCKRRATPCNAVQTPCKHRATPCKHRANAVQRCATPCNIFRLQNSSFCQVFPLLFTYFLSFFFISELNA